MMEVRIVVGVVLLALGGIGLALWLTPWVYKYLDFIATSKWMKHLMQPKQR